MASASASEAPAPTSTAPAKRSLFKRKIPAPTTASAANGDDGEDAETSALNFFSRSREVFPETIRIQEQEERQNRRRDKEEKREKVEQWSEALGGGDDGDEVITTKKSHSGGTASDSEKDEDPFAKDGHEVNEKRRKRGRSFESTSPPKPRPGARPEKRTSGGSRVSRSPSLPRRASRTHAAQNHQRLSDVVTLSDSEDETTVPISRRTDVPIISSSYDAAPSPPQKPQVIAIEDDPEPELEEVDPFSEFVARARAKLRAAPVPSRTAPVSSTTGASAASPAARAVPSPAPQPKAPSPIIQIFITSHIAGSIPLLLKRRLDQRLKDVRMAWVDRQIREGLLTEPERETVFLTWKRIRMFDVTTAASMGVKVSNDGKVLGGGDGEFATGPMEGNVHLEAWTGRVWEEVLRREKEERERRERGYDPVAQAQAEEENRIANRSGAADSPMDVDAAPVAAPAAEHKEPRIKLILRTKAGDELKLMVKPSTVAAAVIDCWRNQKEGGDKSKKIELRFDGDVLGEEVTMQEADVEEMSCVEVYVS